MDGKPVIYWIGVTNLTVPSDAGLVVLVNCTNIIVQNLTLTGNDCCVILYSTQNSTVTGNQFCNSSCGILLMGNSSFNQVVGNTFDSNQAGITLKEAHYLQMTQDVQIISRYPDNNFITENTFTNNTQIISQSAQFSTSELENVFYHNNFINNTLTVGFSFLIDMPPLTWDNGKEGNYWSDYTGTDLNGDGIGDTAYHIMVPMADSTGQVFEVFGSEGAVHQMAVGEDHFPLMHPFSSDN